MSKTTSPRPFAFVLMPFDREFDDEYNLAIKPACDAAGAYAERVDEQVFTGTILDRICNQIAKADIVIADLTGRNPNVFYEAGYAHALGKTTLLLTRSADEIEFDLNQYPHIVHGGRLTELGSELERRVRWHLENPRKAEPKSGVLTVRVNEVALAGIPTIDVPLGGGNEGFILRIDLHNMTDRVLRVIEFKIGLFTPKAFSSSGSGKCANNIISSDDKRNLHLPDQVFSMLPGTWETTRIGLNARTRKGGLKFGETFEFSLRAYFESHLEDFPFVVKVVQREENRR
jgi:hypothetical protein